MPPSSIAVAAVALTLAPAVAIAQDTWTLLSDLEVGARYWYSSGKLKRSHNAQSSAPLLGNPTSVLTFDKMDTDALEVFGRKGFGSGYFVKGLAGVGRGHKGNFRDEDF